MTPSHACRAPLLEETTMSSHDDKSDGVSRRKVLECMTWAGTGVLWTVAGGIPTSLGIMGEAAAQTSGMTFLQISEPCRLRQAGQSESAGHARRGDQQGQGASRPAGLHD